MYNWKTRMVITILVMALACFNIIFGLTCIFLGCEVIWWQVLSMIFQAYYLWYGWNLIGQMEVWRVDPESQKRVREAIAALQAIKTDMDEEKAKEGSPGVSESQEMGDGILVTSRDRWNRRSIK